MSGIYNITVKGTNIPQGPQPFALVISGAVNPYSNWKEEWMGENSEEGQTVTTSELQDAINHWLNDIPVRRYKMSSFDLQEIIAAWLLE